MLPPAAHSGSARASDESLAACSLRGRECLRVQRCAAARALVDALVVGLVVLARAWGLGALLAQDVVLRKASAAMLTW
jgi:hypothetical protein